MDQNFEVFRNVCYGLLRLYVEAEKFSKETQRQQTYLHIKRWTEFSYI